MTSFFVLVTVEHIVIQAGRQGAILPPILKFGQNQKFSGNVKKLFAPNKFDAEIKLPGRKKFADLKND